MNPLAALEPERSPQCASDYALDRWLSGELQHAEAAALEAHVESCARCGERRALRTSERAEWQRRPHGVIPGARIVKPKRMRASLLAASGVLAMAAAALLIVRGGEHTAPDTVRTKGTRSLGFYVKHGQGVRRGAQGEAVAPGDALRFVYTSEHAGYFAVLSVDGARRASIYYPSAADRAAAIEAGRDVPLPLSTVLDDVLGQEALFGVFCEQPIALEPLRRALEADARAVPPPGCSFDRLVIEKALR
jgi:hypothetical protein